MSAAAVIPIKSPDEVWLEPGQRPKWQIAVLEDLDLPAGARLFGSRLALHCLRSPRWKSSVEKLGAEIGLKRRGAYASYAALCERGYAKKPADGYLEIVPLAMSQCTNMHAESAYKCTDEPRINKVLNRQELKRHTQETTTSVVAADVCVDSRTESAALAQTKIFQEAANAIPVQPESEQPAPAGTKIRPLANRAELETYGKLRVERAVLGAREPLLFTREMFTGLVNCFRDAGYLVDVSGLERNVRGKTWEQILEARKRFSEARLRSAAGAAGADGLNAVGIGLFNYFLGEVARET